MRRALLIGSTGYLGRTIVYNLQAKMYVVPTYRREALFAQSELYDFWIDDLQFVVEQYQIDTIVVAANMAYEAAQPDMSFTLFQQQAQKLIRSCQQCRVIYISSDGIFDGKQGRYVESDIPIPMTLYGRNLAYLEHLVQTLCTNYCIIRPSYLYGYTCSKLDPRLSKVRMRLLVGEQLSFFSDMIKSPMEVNQVAQAITMLTCSDYVGIVHIAGEALSIYDFYQQAMLGLDIATDGLVPVRMPTNFQYPGDTSLNNSLMRVLTKIEPLSVYEALKKRCSQVSQM